jgi:teichuronic acid biosynthesis glycosyltransferase TuaC
MRLTLITNVFPSPIAPTKGTFNLELAKGLARDHTVNVVVPIAWTDESRAWWKNGQRMPRSREAEIAGIRTLLPRFWFPPRVAQHRYDSFLERSLRPTLNSFGARQLPDVVLGYWAHPDGAVAVRWAHELGVPGWIMVGGSDVLLLAKQPRRGAAIDHALFTADGIIAVSKHIAEALAIRGIPRDKIHVVYRGVDPEQFHLGDRQESRRRLGLPFDGVVLLWVGRMVEVKGLDTLLSAAKLVKERFPFRLCLVGDGPQRIALQSLVAANHLENEVRFVGSVPHEELATWYQAADWTVLSSVSEGVPNVLLESHACGTPFVATAVGGVPEIAVDGADLLVPSGNVEALAEAICNAIAQANPPRQELAASIATIESSVQQISELLLRGAETVRDRMSNASSDRLPSSIRCDPVLCPVPQRIEVHSKLRQLARRTLDVFLPNRVFAVRGGSSDRAIFLTFDDGPDPEHTAPVLDALAEAGAKATFFVVGEKAERRPDLVRRIVREGHAIGNHTWSHCDPRKTSVNVLLAEVRRTRALIEELTGVSTALFRPPYGKLSASQFLTLVCFGYTVALWNVDPKDYCCSTAIEVQNRLAEWHPTAGDIVLLHDRMSHAPEVVRALLENTKKEVPTFLLRSLDKLCGVERPR